MSDFLGGLCVLGLAWIFGAWCAHPGDDDIYIGKTSGYTCAEVLPATQLGEEAKCAVYKLEEPND